MKTILSFLFLFASTIFAQAGKLEAPGHNCVQVNSNEYCVVEVGKSYTMTNRYDEKIEFTNCELDKTSGRDTFVKCKAIYNSHTNPNIRGWTYVTIHHVRIQDLDYIVRGELRNKY